MALINNNYNLGKNTYHSYGKYSHPNMNSSIIQGKLFNQYADKYDSVTKNKGGFLSKLTSGFGSIKEAMGDIDSIQKSNDDLKSTTLITEYEDEMDQLKTEYSTMYNSFIENQSSLSDEERSNIEQELSSKKKRLELLAENIKNEMNTLLKSSELNDTQKDNTSTDSTEGFQDFYIDQTTTHAKLETTKLRMTSNYYFYLVYFIIAVTLLSFTFNVMVNPNADVMNAIFVVGGIVIIFLISKMMS